MVVMTARKGREEGSDGGDDGWIANGERDS